MRRIILAIIIGLTTLACSAETLSFRTTSYTCTTKKSYGWSDWSPTEPSNMLLTIDLSNDIIKINSPKRQIYNIMSYEGTHIDSDGESNIEFRFIDQDGDHGAMLLMVRNDGRSEVYIIFRNMAWVYTVVRL